jgi:predicted nucleic acid-binding protein
VRFWDSSAVVPLLVRQPASPEVDRWLAQDREVALWTLTPLEVTSAIWRLVREGALESGEALAADGRADEMAAASHTVVDVDAVKARARRLLRVHTLRAADAAQLGAALVWASDRPDGRVLHTLDERLAAAAMREGFSVP